jgi:hypothetical protein
MTKTKKPMAARKRKTSVSRASLTADQPHDTAAPVLRVKVAGVKDFDTPGFPGRWALAGAIHRDPSLPLLLGYLESMQDMLAGLQRSETPASFDAGLRSKLHDEGRQGPGDTINVVMQAGVKDRFRALVLLPGEDGPNGYTLVLGEGEDRAGGTGDECWAEADSSADESWLDLGL